MILFLFWRYQICIIDGSIPSVESLKFENGLQIDEGLFSPIDINKIKISPDKYYFVPEEEFSKAIIIKSAGFSQDGLMVTPVYTNSYFIEELGLIRTNLPVVSITANYNDLFDYNNGIFVPGVNFKSDSSEWTGNYYQRGEQWERPSNVEIFNNDGYYIFNNGVGLRTHGGNSRRMPQKGMKIYARGEYGTKEIISGIFPNYQINEFESLVLKPFSASWSGYGAEDYLASLLAQNMNFDHLQTTPAVVYLNGEYWGIYYIQERPDEEYVENLYGLSEDDFVVVENWTGVTSLGISNEFLDLYNYVSINGLESSSNYYEFCKRVDINGLVDYYLFELFIANFDWSANNMKCWLNRETGKWNWIFFDADAAFDNSDFNSFDHAIDVSDDYWPNNEISTLFFRELSKNKKFSQAFINRLFNLLYTEFSFDNVETIIDKIFIEISPNVEMQINRFKFPETVDIWAEICIDRRMFLLERPCVFVEHVEKYFNSKLPDFDCSENQKDVCIIDVFPLPARGDVTIVVKAEFIGPAVLNITDVLGRRVFAESVFITSNEFSLNIDLAELQNGIYMLNLIFDDNIIGKQIQIMR
jgi:hypothetical protein